MGPAFADTPLFSLPAIFGMMTLSIVVTTGCSGIESVPDPDRAGESHIELDVEPETADIFIDGDYFGTVDGWRHQIVPVDPGHRRLKLEADGYLPQRFDVELDEGRRVTVRVRLEPAISPPEDSERRNEPDGPDDEVTPPDHPAAPD